MERRLRPLPPPENIPTDNVVALPTRRKNHMIVEDVDGIIHIVTGLADPNKEPAKIIEFPKPE